MALGVLSKTREADWSAAVTGHVGPDAPEELDGIVFVAIARRGGDDDSASEIVIEKRARLSRHSRAERIVEAATMVLSELTVSLSE